MGHGALMDTYTQPWPFRISFFFFKALKLAWVCVNVIGNLCVSALLFGLIVSVTQIVVERGFIEAS